MKNFKIIIFILLLFFTSNIFALTTGDSPDDSVIQPPPPNVGKGFIRNIGNETNSSPNSSQDFFETETETGDNLLFVSDTDNNRILIYNLNPDGTLQNNEPNNVLGQSDFSNFNSGNGNSELNSPKEIIYDKDNKILFVADFGNDRVVAFDISLIKNGMPFFDFFEFNNPVNISYNSLNGELLVLDEKNNQKIFDVSKIIQKTKKPSSFWWILFIVLILCASAVVIFWISFQKINNNVKIK